ncbi:MAG TPA: hypothetical protein VMB71_15475 [Acetobacteraceae bacterium]|nr:hypothetical protein [Acetobacteraceae bacterium]
MAEKFARCTNRDYCSLGARGLVMRLADGERFYCPECARALTPARPWRSGPSISWPVAVVAAAGAVLGAGLWLAPRHGLSPAVLPNLPPAPRRVALAPDEDAVALAVASQGLVPVPAELLRQHHHRIRGPRISVADADAGADLLDGVPPTPGLHDHEPRTGRGDLSWRQALILAALMSPDQPPPPPTLPDQPPIAPPEPAATPRPAASSPPGQPHADIANPWDIALARPPAMIRQVVALSGAPPASDADLADLQALHQPVALAQLVRLRQATVSAPPPVFVAYLPPTIAPLYPAIEMRLRAVVRIASLARPPRVAMEVKSPEIPKPAPAQLAALPPAPAPAPSDNASDAADAPAPRHRVVVLPTAVKWTYGPLKDLHLPDAASQSIFVPATAVSGRIKPGKLKADCVIETSGLPSNCHLVEADNAASVSDALVAWLGSGFVHFAPKEQNGKPVRSRRIVELDLPGTAVP